MKSLQALAPALVLMLGAQPALASSARSRLNPEMPAIQDPAPVAGEEPAAEPTGGAASAGDAEALRSRIHDMRMNLLLGGDKVREAERQAADFYSGKSALVEDRLDSIEVELAEKRASYDVSLARALEAPNLEAKRKAMGEAGLLRAEITELDEERTALGGKRDQLGQLVAAVEARDRDRDRLVAKLETTSDFGHELGMPLFSIGLAPVTEAAPASSPFEDGALIEDLLARDPLAARGLLFDLDPAGYWQRFPLQPPRAALAEALAFPLPDLPGTR
jgi:hypothetical protein